MQFSVFEPGENTNRVFFPIPSFHSERKVLLFITHSELPFWNNCSRSQIIYVLGDICCGYEESFKATPYMRGHAAPQKNIVIEILF